MISPIEVAFVTACTAFVSAFMAPFIAFHIGKAQIRAAVVSTNRQRWIETLRDLIASFCAQTLAAAPVRSQIPVGSKLLLAQDLHTLAKIEDVAKTVMTIRLMINPAEEDHRALVEQLDAAVAIFRRPPPDLDLEAELEIRVGRLVTLSQMILKREWRRVKTGS